MPPVLGGMGRAAGGGVESFIDCIAEAVLHPMLGRLAGNHINRSQTSTKAETRTTGNRQNC